MLTAFAVALLAVAFGGQAAQAEWGDVHEVVIEVTPSGDVVATEGDTVRFDASATHLEGNVPADYFWFSWRVDGEEVQGDQSEDPIFEFKREPGNYVVTLSVWGHPENVEDGPPTADEVNINVRVEPSEVPKAVISPAGTVDLLVTRNITFTGEDSVPADATCTWDVDGVKPTTLSSCDFFFFAPDEAGRHVVTLTVTHANGSSDKASTIVNVKPAGFPTARFSPGTDQSIQLPRSITFDGGASTSVAGGPLTYEWYVTGANAIDGVASRTKTFTAQFTKPGTSTVRLVVRDEDGYSDGKRVTINTFTTRCAKPAADATVKAGTSLTFESACWTNNPKLDVSYMTYSWRTTGKAGVASWAPRYSRTFDKAGRYGVELSVVDRYGERSRVHRTITVEPSIKPIASFTPAVDSTVPIGTRVAFNGSASVDPDGGALTHRWYTTGIRGAVSKTNSYARTFTKAGKYRVRLEVTDDERDKVAKTVEITVKDDAKPVASFTPARDTTVGVGSRVAFNGSASVDPDGGALTHRWYTTGISGAVSKTNSYARTFTKAGKYRVRLEVFDDEGNRSTKTVEITVR